MNIIVSFVSFKDIFSPKFLDKILSLILVIILILFAGLRFKVGGDWGSYALIYDEISRRNFTSFIYNFDSLFYTLNYVVSLVGLKHGFILVNLIASTFVFICFYRFIFANHLNLTSFLIFFPYVIMIIMGFTRQSIVLGFFFLILSLNLDKSKISTVFLAIISGFFHFSGYLLSFVVFNNFNKKQNNFYSFLMILLIIIIVILFIYLNLDKIIHKFYFFQNNFNNISSLIRNFPILLSCFLFINFRQYFKNVTKNYNFYLKLSIFGIILYFSTFLFNTISDRLLIYLIPLAILVFSKLLNYFSSNYFKFIYLFSLNIFFACFLFGWLIVGNSGNSWIPYDVLLEPQNQFFNSLIKDLPRFEFTYEKNQ